MSSTAAPVAFIGADELSVELATSFLRSGARVRSFVPEVSLCSPRSPTFRSSSPLVSRWNFSGMITRVSD